MKFVVYPPTTQPAAQTGLPKFPSGFVHTPADAVLEQQILDRIGPIERNITDHYPDGFIGDNPDSRHAWLWAKDQMIAKHGGLPPVTERVPLTIVGGGLAGTAMAYKLKKFKPVVIEQGPRTGGTSRAEHWKGLTVALGAEYFQIPKVGSRIYNFLNEIDVLKDMIPISEGANAAELSGDIFSDLWSGETDLVRAHEFKKVQDYLKKLHADNNHEAYPRIPCETAADRAIANALDGETIFEHLSKIVGGKWHHHLYSAIQSYCSSALDGASEELSAAQTLNFLTGDMAGIAVLPGTNAAIVEAMLKRVLKEVPEENIRCNNLVIDVARVDDGVIITYVKPDNTLHRMHAGAVVMACPKFVVGKILNGIEPDRVHAIKQMKTRPYLMANVVVNGNSELPYYDIYRLGDGNAYSGGIEAASNKIKSTDVILANYGEMPGNKTAFTLHWPLPYDSAMAQLLSPDALKKYTEAFGWQITDEILPALGLHPEDVEGLRIVRWGHAMPLATKGLIKNGTVDILRRPFKERVFFVMQDNWALPSMESVVEEALHFAPQVEAVLEQS